MSNTIHTVIIALQVETTGEKYANSIKGKTYPCIDDVLKELKSMLPTLEPDSDVLALTLPDLVDQFNNEQIDLSGYWISYVMLESKKGLK